jgi:hypothetical protein
MNYPFKMVVFFEASLTASAKANEVLKWLYPGSFSTRFEGIQALQAPNTGQRFLEEVMTWLEETSQLMLCPGLRTMAP